MLIVSVDSKGEAAVAIAKWGLREKKKEAGVETDRMIDEGKKFYALPVDLYDRIREPTNHANICVYVYIYIYIYTHIYIYMYT